MKCLLLRGSSKVWSISVWSEVIQKQQIALSPALPESIRKLLYPTLRCDKFLCCTLRYPGLTSIAEWVRDDKQSDGRLSKNESFVNEAAISRWMAREAMQVNKTPYRFISLRPSLM